MSSQIFISYSHLDDVPFGAGNDRWVEQFERALLGTIGARIPGLVNVWRDKRKIEGNDYFDDLIENELDRSSLLILVVSNNYVLSEYCKKEVQSFGKKRLDRGDLRVGTRSRIIKVYRNQVTRDVLRKFAGGPDALIQVIDGTTGYEFFQFDEKGIDRDLLITGKKEVYWQRADDIAVAIQGLIKAAEATEPTEVVPATDKRRAIVYLARSASDMKESREVLRRELEDRGHLVLPQGELPELAEDYEATVKSDLNRARLSVHLFGRRYGMIPDGASKSGATLQADLAIAQAKPDRQCIVWVAPEGSPEVKGDAAQQAYLSELESATLPKDVEFLRSPFSQLKSLVLDRLTPPPPVAASTAADGLTIYLIHDPVDEDSARPLQVALRALGYQVQRSPMEGTPDELLQVHKACLVGSDAVVIYWGKCREAWVRQKLADITQARGWGRDKPYKAVVVCKAAPDSSAKQDFVPPGASVLAQDSNGPPIEHAIGKLLGGG